MTRIRPTADVTLYVAPPSTPAIGSWGDGVQVTIPSGCDSTGEGTKTSPFATLQRAADELYDDYDFRNQYRATIQLALGPPGTAWFYQGMGISGKLMGQGGTLPALTAAPGLPGWHYGKYLPFTLQGDTTGTVSLARGMAIIYPTTGTCLSLTDGAALKIRGFAVDSSLSGIDCIGIFQSFLDFSNILFGTAGCNSGASHISVGFDSTLMPTGDYEIHGSAWAHINTAEGSGLLYDSAGARINVTVSGCPNWQGAFFVLDSNSTIYASNFLVGFSGSATGKKFVAIGNSKLDTGGHLADLPGNVAGTTDDASAVVV